MIMVVTTVGAVGGGTRASTCPGSGDGSAGIIIMVAMVMILFVMMTIVI